MDLSSCPMCKGALLIKEYYCAECKVSFQGEFSKGWSESLSNQQMEFVRQFLTVQGNIKEMEKRLGISYPTVKNRLAEIIRQINPKDGSEDDFTDIFNDLDEGFINVDDAISMIETRRKK